MKLLIEVGAYDGSDSLIYHKEGYEVYTFEPKKDLYLNLVNKTKYLNNYNVFNKAVCLRDGKTMFYICREGGASSILPFHSNDELIKRWGPNRKDIQYSGISYEVDTIRLDTFIEKYNLQDRIIDYLHVDAQGVDFDVLKSLGKYIKNIKAGNVETIIDPNKSIYIGQYENILKNVENFLKNNEFTITYIQPNEPSKCEYNVYFEKY
jgi:FkbM family methyltransferase